MMRKLLGIGILLALSLALLAFHSAHADQSDSIAAEVNQLQDVKAENLQEAAVKPLKHKKVPSKHESKQTAHHGHVKQEQLVKDAASIKLSQDWLELPLEAPQVIVLAAQSKESAEGREDVSSKEFELPKGVPGEEVDSAKETVAKVEQPPVNRGVAEAEEKSKPAEEKKTDEVDEKKVSHENREVAEKEKEATAAVEEKEREEVVDEKKEKKVLGAKHEGEKREEKKGAEIELEQEGKGAAKEEVQVAKGKEAAQEEESTEEFEKKEVEGAEKKVKAPVEEEETLTKKLEKKELEGSDEVKEKEEAPIEEEEENLTKKLEKKESGKEKSAVEEEDLTQKLEKKELKGADDVKAKEEAPVEEDLTKKLEKKEVKVGDEAKAKEEAPVEEDLTKKVEEKQVEAADEKEKALVEEEKLTKKLAQKEEKHQVEASLKEQGETRETEKKESAGQGNQLPQQEEESALQKHEQTPKGSEEQQKHEGSPEAENAEKSAAKRETKLTLEQADSQLSDEPLELKRATHCNQRQCHLPDCRCSEMSLPLAEFRGKEEQIPQFVLVTFDDAVRADNFEIYQELFEGLVNPDHCAARGTFFVSHEYTDYAKLNALFAQGHEIALHSISHGTGTDYWREADEELITKEFGQQITMIERFAKISRKHIHGMRMPYLQLAGNTTFVAAKRLGLEYDSSWPSQNFQNGDALWPYTMDYRSSQDCQIGPCPTASVPGFWISPMMSWTDTKGYSCAMMDACVYPPANDVDSIFEWMVENFNRHYEHNRAPFGVYLHASWFARASNNMRAFRKFLEFVATLPDAYMVPIHRVLDYMREPVLGKPFKSCPKAPFSSCKPRKCTVRKLETDELRYMTVCDRCPLVYPWLDNPQGKLR